MYSYHCALKEYSEGKKEQFSRKVGKARDNEINEELMLEGDNSVSPCGSCKNRRFG
jgi:hypothetical protein